MNTGPLPDDRYRALFEHSSDAHLIILEGGILDCNQAAIDLLGCSTRDEVLAIHPAELSPERQPDGQLSLEKSKEMDATAHAQGWHRFEWTHRSKQGEDLPVEVTLNSVDFDGKQGLLAVWHDLRAIKRREQELRTVSEALQEANAKMKTDLEAAARVQAALLPRVLPEVEGIGIAWEFLPAEELAGDILDVFLLDARHLAFYVLDVSGHGVAASLLSVTASHFLSPTTDASFLRRYAGSDEQRVASPMEVAARLNQQFPSREGAVQFFTLFCGVLDLDTLELRYACAAHPGAVLLRRGGEVLQLEHPGLPIGIVSHAEYEEESIRLEAGDRIFVFSDGIPEARSDEGAFYGTERLITIARDTQGRPLRASVDRIVEDVHGWCGTHGPQDDVSALAIEVRGPARPE